MKNKKKKICIVTGSRADYDLLKNLITHLQKRKKFKLSLIVTGQHISKNYGNTKKKFLKTFVKFARL